LSRTGLTVIKRRGARGRDAVVGKRAGERVRRSGELILNL
jgi:hypothetical protein